MQLAMDIKKAITIPEKPVYCEDKNYNLLNEIYNSDLDKMILTVEKVLDIEKDIFHYDNKGFLWVFDITLKESKVEIINEFLANYIQEYEQDKLISSNNYYSFEKTIANIDQIFNAHYKTYGKRFNVNKDMIKTNELKFYELLLYLNKKGFINLNTCNVSIEKRNDYVPF